MCTLKHRFVHYRRILLNRATLRQNNELIATATGALCDKGAHAVKQQHTASRFAISKRRPGARLQQSRNLPEAYSGLAESLREGRHLHLPLLHLLVNGFQLFRHGRRLEQYMYTAQKHGTRGTSTAKENVRTSNRSFTHRGHYKRRRYIGRPRQQLRQRNGIRLRGTAVTDTPPCYQPCPVAMLPHSTPWYKWEGMRGLPGPP